MDKLVRILIVEDMKTDFDLAQREIRKSVKNCEFQQVETRNDFLNALETFQPDVILSDYSLPRFDGMTALKLTLEHMPLTPFIVWTGSISEDIAVDCMKAGANNYILKENIRRLGPAIVHALEEGQLLLEHKQADEKLRESEERFRALIENSLENISLLAEDGTLLWENPAVNRTLGYPQDAFVGHNIFELMHPDDLEWTTERFTKLMKRPGETECGVFRLQHQDGTWRWIEAIVTNLLNEPSVQATIINYRDITERKQAEIEIEQRNDDLGLINTINEAVIQGEGLDSIVKLLGKEVKRIFSSVGSTISIYILSPDGQSLIMQQYYLEPALNRKIEQLIGGSIPLIHIPIREGSYFQKVLNSSQGIITSEPKEIQGWIAEFVETPFLPPAARGTIRKLIPQIYKLLNIKSIICVPLLSNGTTIGVMDISSSNLLTANDLKRIENMSGQLTAAIQRQQAIDKVRKSEGFLQSVQNALSASIAILNKEGTIIQVNSAWRKFGELNGLTHPESGIGLNYLDICDSATGPYAEEAPSVTNAIREIIAGQRREALIEYPCHSPKEKRWYGLHITKFEDGDQTWVVLAHENITERKQAEEHLKETSEQFRTLFEASPDAIMLVDPQGKWPILDCNETACSMNGYTRDELVGQSVNIFNITSGTPDERTEYLEKVRENGILRYETMHRHKNGIVFPVEVSTSLISLGGREVILGIDRDITERKRADEQLKRSHSLLSATLESTGDGILVVTSNRRITSFNGKFLELWRIPYNLAAKKDEQVIMDFVSDQLKDPSAFLSKAEQLYRSPEDTYSGELEFQDGRVLELYSQPQRLNNIVVGRVWSFRDITERKRAENELRASEERFRQLADNIQEVFWITDAGSKTDLYLSPAYEELWGRPVEIQYQDPRAFLESIQPDDRPDVLTSLEKQLHGEKTELEYRIARPDGSIRWVWDRAFPILDETGKVSRVAGIAADITERKLAEENLRESEERYRQLLNMAPVGVGVHIEGKLVFANLAAARIVGANSIEELIGIPVMDLVDPEERIETIKTLQRMLKGEEDLYPREERFVCLDGSIINVEVTATPLTYMGKPAVQVIVQDITERKQTEKEIERHFAELEAVYENGLAVGRLLKPREIGDRVINTFTQYLSWHHVTIRILKDGSDDLELIAFSLPHMKEVDRSRIEQNFADRVNKVGQGMSGWVVQTGQPIRTGNVHNYKQYVDSYEGIQSGLYMPLLVGERVIGVISVESEKPDAFSSQDERLLATLANQAAIAFENARLYQEVQQELSERKRAQEALHTSESHYRELADSITDVFFELDQDLRYTHWNKASEALTGVAAKDAIGKTMRDILGVSSEQTRIEGIYEHILSAHQPQTFETTFLLKQGARSFEINAYPSTRGVSVVAKDVTDRKRAEVIFQKRFELMEYSAHHSLEDLMQRVTDELGELTGSEIGFFHFMEDDQTTPGKQIWSTNALELFHVPVSEGGHLPLEQAGVWADAARQRHSVIHNDYESLPHKKKLPEGHAKIVRELVIPIIRNDKIKAVLGFANKQQEYTREDIENTERFADYAWDITERKQMEVTLATERNQLAARVEERTAELIKANSNLARAIRVKDEFLANMSHELRTPLNAILGLSESLAEQIAGPLNDKQQKYITTIGESGHHLLSLINDILDLAKIEAGQITLDITRVDVNAVSQASLRMVKQLAQKKNQEISLEIDSDLGLIWADERRLKQMIVNLLSNAVKFTPQNGKIGLDIHGYQDDNMVELSVWDNGIGISDDDLSHLFQPFVQLDSGLARESTGTGLGLALVSQMARLHGGSISVHSDPGKGSRFTVTLPWEPAIAEKAIQRLHNTGKLSLPETPSENKKDILLVEDTIEVTMMLKDYLETAGYNVTIAEDGVEGIEKAKLIHPDLILMDVQMPRMDGIETTKRLRDDPNFKYVPIIALTAQAMPIDRERCLEAGMNEYISKPVNLRALVKLIQKNISNAEEKTRPQ